ncbi:MAG: HNH endonuclease signature motif containing protein [Phycisphaerales bacterium]
MDRPNIPADTVRAVLVEAGHRCAIPTCRATTTEIAHIEPWAKSHDNSLANLIALCPTCHARFDQKKEIDSKSIRLYKQNLALVNNRYGEFERRLFEIVARTGNRVFVVGAGGDILLANVAKDGLFRVTASNSYGLNVEFVDGTRVDFPMTFICEVTPIGLEFVQRYMRGAELS